MAFLSFFGRVLFVSVFILSAWQDAESGTDDSLDASDENNNLELASSSKKGSFHQMLAEGVTAQNNDGARIQTSVLGKPVVSIAATNLNIGMGSWNGSPAYTMKSRQENGVTSAAQDHQWMQVQIHTFFTFWRKPKPRAGVAWIG